MIPLDSLAQATTVDATPTGTRLGVFDAVTGLVATFDGRTLRPLAIVGGKGEAPGQFPCGSRLSMTDSALYVLDSCHDQVIGVTPAGRDIGRYRLPTGDAKVPPYGQFSLAHDTLLFTRRYSALKAPETSGHRRRGRDELVRWRGSDVTALAAEDAEWLNLSTSGPPFLVPRPFTHQLLWDLDPTGPRVAVSADSTTHVLVIDVSGSAVAELRLPGAGRAVRNGERSRLVDAYRAEFQRRPTVDVSRLVFPDHHPAIRALRFDPSGRLWIWLLDTQREEPDSVAVLRWTPGQTVADRFSVSCFPLAFLTPTRIVCRRRDAFGVDALHVFELSVVPS